MAEEYGGDHSLVTPAGTIAFNAASGDTYAHDATKCAGLGSAPLRTAIDDKPQAPGAIVHPFLRGARHLVLSGDLRVRSGGGAAARNALGIALMAALESIEQIDGTYIWTPTGLTAHSLAVRCEISASFPGAFQKSYLFGLVAGDPTVTIA